MLSNTAAGLARQAWHLACASFQACRTTCSLSASPPGHLVAPAGDARFQGYPVALVQVSDSRTHFHHLPVTALQFDSGQHEAGGEKAVHFHPAHSCPITMGAFST